MSRESIELLTTISILQTLPNQGCTLVSGNANNLLARA